MLIENVNEAQLFICRFRLESNNLLNNETPPWLGNFHDPTAVSGSFVRMGHSKEHVLRWSRPVLCYYILRKQMP